MAKEAGTKTKLCPFKKIVSRDYNGHSGRAFINERFAPCAGDRCMAHRGDGGCARLEGGKWLGRTSE